MKKDVLITIVGVQRVDGDVDTVELTTCGRFYRKSEDYFLCYDESEATGFEGCRTTLHLERSGRVTMRRSGRSNTHLVVEKGRRHQCLYDTGFGPVTVGICGDNVRSTLTESGGMLDFSYSLDINAALASENRVIIKVKECDSNVES